MKKVAILQSNYIPWKGNFDLIGKVDEFILYDDMQFTRRDWRNRNKIKTANGLLWLTIPVVNDDYYQKINATKVVDGQWATKHLKTLKASYAKAPYFKKYDGWLTDLYEQAGKEEYLSKINYLFLVAICDFLKIKTKISWSSDYEMIEGKTERLIDLVLKAGGQEYISGPAAKDYIVPELFDEANVKLTWMDYAGYPEYHQLYPPFEHGVSILDLILNEGENAPEFMHCFNLAK